MVLCDSQLFYYDSPHEMKTLKDSVVCSDVTALREEKDKDGFRVVLSFIRGSSTPAALAAIAAAKSGAASDIRRGSAYNPDEVSEWVS